MFWGALKKNLASGPPKILGNGTGPNKASFMHFLSSNFSKSFLTVGNNLANRIVFWMELYLNISNYIYDGCLYTVHTVTVAAAAATNLK